MTDLAPLGLLAHPTKLPVFTFLVDPRKTLSGVLVLSPPNPNIALNLGWAGQTAISFHNHPVAQPMTRCVGTCPIRDYPNTTSESVTVNALYWYGYGSWTQGDLDVREVTLDPSGKIATVRLFLSQGNSGDNLFLSVR